MDQERIFENPLVTRYAGREMAALWSPRRRILTWRKLWLALAKAERQLGLGISSAQIDDLERHLEEIDWESAREHEKRLRHDVMAHVHTFGEVATLARPIIHLGATSCYVTDNTDLLLMREALELVRDQLAAAIDALGDFADRWKNSPCLGSTHYQPAQLVTVGKRAALWCLELVLDFNALVPRLETLPFLGVKGTTGTQASFLALFDGNHEKVEELDRMVAAEFGFETTFSVSGQTYTRKIDTQILNILAGIGESGHRFGTDLRLLAHDREIEEPFETEQVGSSAMAYKRNPMRAERMCSLSRFLMGFPAIAAQTAATQWLERTLDDSAVRRLILPQAFLAADAILRLYLNIVPGLVVNNKAIARRIALELPFMATENILMAGVKLGGDRQELHERIRAASLQAAERIKNGESNDLIERLRADRAFDAVNFDSVLNPSAYIGRAPNQVSAFLEREVEPIRKRYLRGRAFQTDLNV